MPTTSRTIRRRAPSPSSPRGREPSAGGQRTYRRGAGLRQLSSWAEACSLGPFCGTGTRHGCSEGIRSAGVDRQFPTRMCSVFLMLPSHSIARRLSRAGEGERRTQSEKLRPRGRGACSPWVFGDGVWLPRCPAPGFRATANATGNQWPKNGTGRPPLGSAGSYACACHCPPLTSCQMAANSRSECSHPSSAAREMTPRADCPSWSFINVSTMAATSRCEHSHPSPAAIDGNGSAREVAAKRRRDRAESPGWRGAALPCPAPLPAPVPRRFLHHFCAHYPQKGSASRGRAAVTPPVKRLSSLSPYVDAHQLCEQRVLASM